MPLVDDVETDDLVHVHHNGDTGTRWGYARGFIAVEDMIVVDYVNGIRDCVAPQYVNKAVLTLNGPLCVRCERERLAAETRCRESASSSR